MVEDRIAALESRAATLEERVRELEGRRAPWDVTRPESPRGVGETARGTGASVPPPRAGDARRQSGAPAWAGGESAPGGAPAWARGGPDGAARPGGENAPADSGTAGASPRPLVTSGAHAWRGSASVPPLSAAPTGPARPPRDLEDILGGSVLAWLGGFAVLAGLAFLLTIAISRGWLGEAERTLLAGALSAGLLATGVWLRERRDQTEAALAAAAVGVAGLFGTLVVAGPVYDLIPNALALAGAAAVGAAATTLAVRWSTEAFAWLGLLGALWAPAALGALDTGGIPFLAIAFAAAVAVLVWRRWERLAWAAAATVTVQWLWWLYDSTPTDTAAALVLTTFGVLTAVLALGLEVRTRGLSVTATALIPAGALVIAAAGWDQLHGDVWLAALAVAHLALGLALTRVPRVSRLLALVTLGTGVLLADAAAVELSGGLALALVWAGSSLVFAALLGARTATPRHGAVARAADAVLGDGGTTDWWFAAIGLVTQLALAVSHVLTFEAPVEALQLAADSTALVAVASIALTAFLSARLADRAWELPLDALALAAVAYFTGLALEGLPLTVALAAEAVALSFVLRPGAIAFAALAGLHALATLAPPIALIDGLDHPLDAALGLLAVTTAIAFSTRSRAATALSALYLASVLTVTAGGPEHTGQTLLSVLWALAGVGTLVFGLVTDERGARRGSLILLAVTATKVFLYDLSELDDLARVASFIGLGLLLLAGAFAWQRVRPRALQ